MFGTLTVVTVQKDLMTSSVDQLLTDNLQEMHPNIRHLHCQY